MEIKFVWSISVFFLQWVCRVDLVRWLILFVHGGVYAFWLPSD